MFEPKNFEINTAPSMFVPPVNTPQLVQKRNPDAFTSNGLKIEDMRLDRGISNMPSQLDKMAAARARLGENMRSESRKRLTSFYNQTKKAHESKH